MNFIIKKQLIITNEMVKMASSCYKVIKLERIFNNSRRKGLTNFGNVLHF
jgi:hypothetical protein